MNDKTLAERLRTMAKEAPFSAGYAPRDRELPLAAADALDAKDADIDMLKGIVATHDTAVQNWGRMIDERDAEIARLRVCPLEPFNPGERNGR